MSAKVYPVKLATVVQCDYSHNVLNTRFGEKIDTAILSFVIIDGKNVIVFDTGHKILNFTKRGQELNLFGDAEENFRKKFDELNLSFEAVTHVALSHLHWDHIQNCDLFPNAKIFIQRKEMAFAAAPLYPLYYVREDIVNLLKDFGDNIVYLDGEDRDELISPNVTLKLLGGHTVGSQVAYIKTGKGTVILTGDICNVYENLETRSVKEVDVIAWTKAIKKMKEEGDIILPQHEPRVVDDYPSIE
jgi:glyoxylase-like metal-dependent hydrolase (beta-lactamase superfamily II)